MLWFHRRSALTAGMPTILTYRCPVHRYRFAVRPMWLLLHVFVLAAVITMILLGRWQLRVSDDKGFNLRNFGYAIQWWLFAVFAIGFWWRIMRDAVRRDTPAALGPMPPPEPVAYRRYVPPTSTEPADPVRAAYNDYLAALAANDEQEQR